ncbi:PKD domain-containing protein [Haladaptatus sp. DJG-WS-42]|uniref:PKD domain-containing protein n=1 Tax=Haladaptatus sp. DJG-WS-42 TaxID=3120516 RepID=UPI0030CC1C35
MIRSVALAIVVVLSLISPVVALSPTNEAPLADAGLDQTVSRGTVVQLDATGSRDPDGQLTAYDWEIYAPNGTLLAPRCRSCARTEFRPTQTGEYTVSVTVTDDAGAKRTDTLYITVETGNPPDVTLAGVQTIEAGTAATTNATISRGGAPLSHIVWTVDGRVVTNRSLSAGQPTNTLSTTFGTIGSHTVRATVYDHDGLTASDTWAIQATSVPSSGGGNTTDGKSPSDEANTPPRSLASGRTPTISGPQTVLGARPLRGSYSITLTGTANAVDRVSWYKDGTVTATGTTQNLTWTPGDHSLFAIVTYTDGSENIARFDDSTTRVVADPQPNVTLSQLQWFGSITGLASGSDAYGNLESVSVSVDGTQIDSTSMQATRLANPNSGAQLDLRFSERVTTQQNQTITVRAVDSKGQVSTTSQVVTPVGKPVVLSSEFVNTPVDSYHTRINASRYAAHHVLEVDLNGVDPDDFDVSSGHYENSEKFELQQSDYRRIRDYNPQTDVLTIHSYWAANVPGTFEIKQTWSVSTRSSNSEIFSGSTSNILEITPSDPELRIEVIYDGTGFYKPDWGIVVDASNSFDPDGSKLRYTWSQGAVPITADNSTAKFDSFELAKITVIDRLDNTESRSYNFHDYFAPNVGEIEEISTGPYFANETVRFRVKSAPFKFTKSTYNVSLGVDVVGADETIVSWNRKVYDPQKAAENGTYDTDELRSEWRTAIIEIPASELTNGEQTEVVIYNEANPERAHSTAEIPEVNTLYISRIYPTNISVSNVSYHVQKPRIRQVTALSESSRDARLADGYTVTRESNTGTEYTIEHLEKIQDAQYTTQTESFGTRRYRDVFLRSNPSWSTAGTSSHIERWTTVETEWRDSQSGRGEFTGNTRQVKVDDADYRLLKEYEHEYTVERTGYRTTSRCIGYGICLPSRERYTYTDEETETYWATSKRSWGDDFTGDTRKEKIDSADYETQYEYRYEEQHQETTTSYIAERTVLSQSAQYEWQHYKTTTNPATAKSLSKLSSEYRIGDTEPTTEWVMTKQIGVTDAWYDHYGDEANVIETTATVTNDHVVEYRSSKTGEKTRVVSQDSTQTYRASGAKSKQEIIDSLSNGGSTGNCNTQSGAVRHCV